MPKLLIIEWLIFLERMYPYMNQTDKVKIQLVRGKQYADFFRKYQIYINDILVGEIKRNSTVEFEVANGNHMIQAKIDGCTSNEYSFETTKPLIKLEVSNVGQIRENIALNSLHNSTNWDDAIDAVIEDRNNYLLIREVS